MKRRNFLRALLVAPVAVKAIAETKLERANDFVEEVIDKTEHNDIIKVRMPHRYSGNTLLTQEEVTNEAISILNSNLASMRL